MEQGFGELSRKEKKRSASFKIVMNIMRRLENSTWIWDKNFDYRHLFCHSYANQCAASQLYVVEEVAVPGDNHCPNPSHWQPPLMPRLDFEPGQW